MSEMNMRNFTNRLRALWNIDYNRLPEMPEDEWPHFRDAPHRYFAHCSDDMQKAIWREVQHRCEKWDVDMESDQ